jgi:hypothetical protein
MTAIVSTLIFLYGLIAVCSAVQGFRQSYLNKNPYGLTRWLLPYGSFVWGDAAVLGAFWAAASAVSLVFHSSQLFLVIQAIFWMVRSAGEVMYWFLQQFSTVKRDKPKTLFGHQFFPGEAIWFVYQLIWQMVFVVASVCLVFLLYHSVA